jgi:hypothetical protein
LHQDDRAGNLADRAFHFRVPRVADQDERATLGDILPPLHVDFRHERAGCVEHVQAARFCVGFDRLRDTVRAENSDCAVRHFIEFFDKLRTFIAQVVHHVPIVDDLVAHVDRRAVSFECAIDNFDRADYTRTKAAGLSKDDTHIRANSD